MKTYINISEFSIRRVEDNIIIPKVENNRDYIDFLELQASGQAQLVELEPVVNWNPIKAARKSLLRDSDWTDLPNTPLTNEQKQAWLDYRQALRDIPQTYSHPNQVIWPQKP